ncbi:unnamed protein product [Candidula unifasciata]|uniref:Small ribosomal subunit protein bS16m n=1 Tax=Candidula unifasciata TaxID=100452 RepID=A0A8S3ZYW6_9EUPU|nr:unnamed protein product [Candidula unifasciata]
MPRVGPKVFQIIKFAYHGCTNRQFFHIVLLDNKSPLNATPYEQLGTFDPLPNIYNEKLVSLDVERIKYHIAQGVALSRPVEKLLGLAGLLPVHPMSYITAKRNRKKLQAEAAAQSEDKNSDHDEQS